MQIRPVRYSVFANPANPLYDFLLILDFMQTDFFPSRKTVLIPLYEDVLLILNVNIRHYENIVWEIM
jgi:hypothetical protein